MHIIFRPRADDLSSSFYSRSVPDAPVVANVLQARRDSARATQQVRMLQRKQQATHRSHI
jgi:hypothetical protein